MTILNFNKLVKTIASMQAVIAAGNGDSGWKSVRRQTGTKKVQATTPVAPTMLSNGGVLKTFELAHETIRGELAGHALTGVTDLWHDGEVHRVINANLAIVHDVLATALNRIHKNNPICNTTDYLVHVNDADVNSSLVRHDGQSFSHLSSQMAIISPNGKVHFLTMDRARCSGVGSYVWRAMSISQDHELSMMGSSTSGQVDPATDYITMGEMRIAMFTRPFSALANSSSSAIEYAYRQQQQNHAAPTHVVHARMRQVPHYANG
jgi:hypothetical protein